MFHKINALQVLKVSKKLPSGLKQKLPDKVQQRE